MLKQSMMQELNFAQSLLSLLKIDSFWLHILPFARISLYEDWHVKDKQNLFHGQEIMLD